MSFWIFHFELDYDFTIFQIDQIQYSWVSFYQIQNECPGLGKLEYLRPKPLVE